MIKSASIYLALKCNGHIKNASPEHDSLWKITEEYPGKGNVLPWQFSKYLLWTYYMSSSVRDISKAWPDQFTYCPPKIPITFKVFHYFSIAFLNYTFPVCFLLVFLSKHVASRRLGTCSFLLASLSLASRLCLACGRYPILTKWNEP